MSLNFSNGITKVLRIMKAPDRSQTRSQAANLQEEDFAVNARDYYQSIIDNSSIKEKTFEEPVSSQSTTGSQAAVQAQASDHWFDARPQNKGPRPSDSSYRLQAFLQTTKNKELKALDKNYLKRKGS